MNTIINDQNAPLEPTKNTKEEIEAAVAACYGKTVPQAPSSKPGRKPKEAKDTKKETRAVDAFYAKCQELDITAKACYDESNNNPDQSIKTFLAGINAKIYDETKNGGYSTNIQFRVSPQEWVNVQHIVDWYRAKGFTVNVTEPAPSPYVNAGSMEYGINISWVNPM